MQAMERARIETWPDEQVVERVLAGETALFEILMRRHNQRLYRAALAILRDPDEAEDLMQEAYVRAYQHLNQFAGRARFSTWLIRIAVNEALSRRTQRNRTDQMDLHDESGGELLMTPERTAQDPEEQTARKEISGLLETAILALPESYRVVLMLRDVEEMSTSETAEALQLSEDNVKTRLHRARVLVRKELFTRAGVEANKAFGFMGERCDRVVRRVFERIGQQLEL